MDKVLSVFFLEKFGVREWLVIDSCIKRHAQQIKLHNMKVTILGFKVRFWLGALVNQWTPTYTMYHVYHDPHLSRPYIVASTFPVLRDDCRRCRAEVPS